jgi:hypothetical protein
VTGLAGAETGEDVLEGVCVEPFESEAGEIPWIAVKITARMAAAPVHPRWFVMMTTASRKPPAAAVRSVTNTLVLGRRIACRAGVGFSRRSGRKDGLTGLLRAGVG